MAETKRVFNLLKPVEKPKDFWDKVYGWIITQARLVIIVVEIFLVLLFFARVIIDNEGKNKRDFFYSNSVFNTLKAFESQNSTEFREIQIKGQEYAKIWNNSSNVSTVFDEAFSIVSPNVKNLSIEVQRNILVIRGQDSIVSINILESSLKRSNSFLEVLVDISSDQRQSEEQIADFTITAKIAEEIVNRRQI